MLKAQLKSILGEKGLITPWGSKIRVDGFMQRSNYIHVGVLMPNEKICELVLKELAVTKRWSFPFEPGYADYFMKDINETCYKRKEFTTQGRSDEMFLSISPINF